MSGEINMEVAVKDFLSQKVSSPVAGFRVNCDTVDEFLQTVWSRVQCHVIKEIIFNDKTECYEWSNDELHSQSMDKFISFQDKVSHRCYEARHVSTRLLHAWKKKESIVVVVHGYGNVLKKREDFNKALKELIQKDATNPTGGTNNVEVFYCKDGPEDLHSDIKPSDLQSTDGLHKSAIIYRDDSGCFIYACFHCGSLFSNIDETLQHIEYHFQLINVVNAEPFTECGRDDHFENSLVTTAEAVESVYIKIENLDETTNEHCVPKTFETVIDGGRSRFRCKICNMIQPSKFLIHLHAVRYHMKEPMECRHCNQSFKLVNHFKKHLKKHIDKGQVDWKCIADGIQTSLQVDWSTYEIITAATDAKNDDDVKKGFNTFMKKPTNTRSTIQLYRCHKCSQQFRYMSTLNDHLQTHDDDDLLKLYRCKECDSYHRNAYALRIHVLEVHRKTKRFGCNACPLQFSHTQKEEFEEHLQLHNGSDNQLWPDIRDGIKHSVEDYSEYEESYSLTDKAHSCEFCSQRFYIKFNFDLHMKSVHSGQRRLPCGQCDSVFTSLKVYTHTFGPSFTNKMFSISLP